MGPLDLSLTFSVWAASTLTIKLLFYEALWEARTPLASLPGQPQRSTEKKVLLPGCIAYQSLHEQLMRAQTPSQSPQILEIPSFIIKD